MMMKMRMKGSIDIRMSLVPPAPVWAKAGVMNMKDPRGKAPVGGAAGQNFGADYSHGGVECNDDAVPPQRKVAEARTTRPCRRRAPVFPVVRLRGNGHWCMDRKSAGGRPLSDPLSHALLERIATALERLAPPVPPAPAFGAADAFVWNPTGRAWSRCRG